MGRGFQHVHIIWSFNLQKLKWRYSKNIMAMERARKRINFFFTANKVCEVMDSVG